MEDASDTEIGSLILGELNVVQMTLGYTEKFIETVELESKEVVANGTKS